MLAVKNILCATDFSESSDFAFRVACALARDYGARLTALHVILPPLGAYGEGGYLPPPEEYEEGIHEKLVKLQPHDPRIVTDHRLEEGEAVPTILWVAGQTHADVIVMGTHGRKGLGRLLMGSVAEQVVRKASCPVLTVKKPVPAARPPVDADAEVPAMSQ
jgi:universal stress protein A